MKPEDVKSIQFVWSDDWCAMYVNGKLAIEDHSIDGYEALEAVGFVMDQSFTVYEKDMEDLELGFPELFAELEAHMKKKE